MAQIAITHCVEPEGPTTITVLRGDEVGFNFEQGPYTGQPYAVRAWANTVGGPRQTIVVPIDLFRKVLKEE